MLASLRSQGHRHVTPKLIPRQPVVTHSWKTSSSDEKWKEGGIGAGSRR